MRREFEVNGDIFLQGSRVSLVVKLNDESTRRLNGTLHNVVKGEAYLDTEYGIFVGDAATLESEEDAS